MQDTALWKKPCWDHTNSRYPKILNLGQKQNVTDESGVLKLCGEKGQADNFLAPLLMLIGLLGRVDVKVGHTGTQRRRETRSFVNLSFLNIHFMGSDH